MKKILVITILVFIISSCKKTELNGVSIRIENTTNFSFDSVKLFYDTSYFIYGTIAPDQTTDYHFFVSIPDAAVTNFISNGKNIIAGSLFPPNFYSYPTLANGKYTLQIFADASFPFGYNGRFIKN